MRRGWPALLLVVAGLATLVVAPGHAAPRTRTIVDSAGRRIEVPARIERVFAAGPTASILVYSLAPDRLVGWDRPLPPAARPFLPAPYAALPTLGRLTGRGGTANIEAVLAAQPDVIVDYGVVRPTYVSLAERVQQQTGIPYVLIDGGLSAIPRAYELLGRLLDVPALATERGQYAARLLRDVDERVARVPHDVRPRVYYGRGPQGLQTGLEGSINVESLERLGVRNVAAEHAGRGGLVTVSLEQILAWNPDVIVTIDAGFAAAVGSDPRWRDVNAVHRGRVYLAPLLPFPWIDFPPSVNRLIGLAWLGRIFYPDVFTEDLRQQARRFYALFYHRGPDERQLRELLSGTGRGGQ